MKELQKHLRYVIPDIETRPVRNAHFGTVAPNPNMETHAKDQCWSHRLQIYASSRGIAERSSRGAASVPWALAVLRLWGTSGCGPPHRLPRGGQLWESSFRRAILRLDIGQHIGMILFPLLKSSYRIQVLSAYQKY